MDGWKRVVCWVMYNFFRRSRRTEDNLFMLERMIEMTKVRKECLFVDFIDIEKAYERVNRKKLVEVMRGYGVQEKLVNVIERIYDGGMVKIDLEGIMTGWCRSDSGVRQGCPLSPLLFVVLCLPTPLTLVCGGSPIIPLLVHQPAYLSIWPAYPSIWPAYPSIWPAYPSIWPPTHHSRGDSVVRM